MFNLTNLNVITSYNIYFNHFKGISNKIIKLYNFKMNFIQTLTLYNKLHKHYLKACKKKERNTQKLTVCSIKLNCLKPNNFI